MRECVSNQDLAIVWHQSPSFIQLITAYIIPVKVNVDADLESRTYDFGVLWGSSVKICFTRLLTFYIYVLNYF
jgi:hypothetical protein